MSINFKFHKIENKEDIFNKLLLFENKSRKIRNIYLIKCKDIKNKSFLKNSKGEDRVIIEATVNKIRNIQRYMKIMSSNFCHVILINAKNKNGQYFSSFVNDLSSKDQIFFFNGTVSAPVSLRRTMPTITFRNEYLSSVYLFKYDSPDWINKVTPTLKWLMEPNLSTINGPGKYSLFGHIISIMKFADENLMLIQLKSHDKLKVNVLKYPHRIPDFWRVLKQGSALNEDDVHLKKYECGSNRIDILVLKPCSEFLKLENNVRVHLKNIKCKQYCNINHQPVFLLRLKGKTENMQIVPIETVAVKSLRPPASKPCFKIPDDLNPTISKASGSQQNNKLNITKAFVRRLLEDSPPPSNSNYPSSSSSSSSSSSFLSYGSINEDKLMSRNSIQQSEENLNVCVDLINQSPIMISDDSDDTVILNDSDCASPSVIRIADISVESISSAITISSDDDEDNNVTPLLNKTTNKRTRNQIYINAEIIPTFTINDDDLHDTPQPISNQNYKSIGPCRLVLVDPYVFDGETTDIVSGYCTKCKSFKKLSSLLILSKNNKDKIYMCSDCETLLCLTFYFKMTFLFGQNGDEAIEVHCYDNGAEIVLKKIVSDSITVENYLSSISKYNKEIASAFKKIIIDKTKFEVQVKYSEDDNTALLFSFDY
ncbi:uncharacterized protein LOC126901865 isoform X2 [Daktulosphaira vitifoliae]|nr:uncharacterized protein LOC126901865 isoform X2 [Daktulosphaira vitifoliae]